MQVRVRLFAGLRERAGTAAVELELPDGARVQDALDRLSAVAEDVPVVMAINREYAPADAPLHAGRRAGADPTGVGRVGRARCTPA